MIISVVGSGGKTTLIKQLASRYRAEGKTVLVTTTTHMFIEEDTFLTDDAQIIIHSLKETGYAMAGTFGGNLCCGLCLCGCGIGGGRWFQDASAEISQWQ